ncbi:HAMP domain-containing protein [Deinococcus sp. AJ005]|uniref:HAMP domain-containing protein n=1 Tax=Deinococcus sp. AJ005 TaxID=2652443 RepID=UPI00125CC9E8|nr:HAMP domain-containing protein [Deinococcus sp. AJ005]QFP77536.1 HAMP domain-containing protein [Deinococcus sp. AJ005]
MKYTVTIQQPVQAERRRALEQQLSERFSLSAEQAGRLSGRRTGRLMKPTSRARAELLLDVFQLAGAAVALEEVQEETQMLNEPFQGLAPSPATPFARNDAPDEAFLASPMPAPAWPGSPESTSASPFDNMSTAVVTNDPFSTSAFGGSSAQFSGGGLAVASPLTSMDTALGQTFGSASLTSSTPLSDMPPSDVWSDFTGALTMTDATATPAAPSSGMGSAAAMVPVVLPAGTGEAEPKGPRRSLTRQLTLGTLAPLALSSAVTLGVLALVLPAVQRQAAQEQARTLAAAVGANLGSGAQLSAQIGALAATPGVGFVRAEFPGGQTTLRAQDAGVGSQNRELSAWLGSHPNGGTLKLGGTQYVIAQATFRKNAAGKAEVMPAGAAQNTPVLRQVVVGVPNTQATSALRNALLLVLLAALLGLALGGWLAGRAARQITRPIERLVKAADAISMGDLSRPVHADQNDEIGDLSQALERMRQSLEAAMERLRRRRKT